MKHQGFTLVSEYTPKGDQPEAISSLVKGIEKGLKFQTLKGVTGSGKTFTMANVIQQIQRPTLVLAHNKTLAGQLCTEFRQFFPHNAVEYFISYYDYYQPEAYIAASDTYIEKDSAINDEIDRLRHSATAALLERRDVIVVASVSCIYGLGSPINYKNMMLHLRQGQVIERDQLIEELVRLQYVRNDIGMKRGTFRVRGDVVDVFPVNAKNQYLRVHFFDNEIEQLTEIEALKNKVLAYRNYVCIYPASHYASNSDLLERASKEIEEELLERVKFFREKDQLMEAYRLEQRTRYDLQMIRETGFTKGIENYSRYLDGRTEGQAPYTLLDFFPKDYLLFIDESHVSIPQVGAMYAGDRARKTSLVDYGFRLPSAFDNRPLRFEEFEERMGATIMVSATPAQYEEEHQENLVKQILRPTGLLDPEIEIVSTEGQIEDLEYRLKEVIARGERALILTLTKKMAEDFSEFLTKAKFKVNYLHSDIASHERLQILRDLREGKIDVLIGINLLREGIDLPEVSLMAIMDADKEGFLRSERSLIQMIGRAARNAHGRVILYADQITDSMFKAVQETNERRALQQAFNQKHGIIPKTISKELAPLLSTKTEERKLQRDEELWEMDAHTWSDEKVVSSSYELKQNQDIVLKVQEGLAAEENFSQKVEQEVEEHTPQEITSEMKHLEEKMKQASKELQFELAAQYRDAWLLLKKKLES